MARDGRADERRTRRLGVAIVLAGLMLALPSLAAAVEPVDPTVAPTATLADDGLWITDGVRTLRVTQAASLSPDGQTVTVSGTGYDTAKGIYVAMCLIPAPNTLPTPCGGGIDIDGSSNASLWVNSSVPDYGEGLAVPYGPNGSFEATVNVGPMLDSVLDCRIVRCAIVTRNDHLRTVDRSQDLFIPVTFAESAAATAEYVATSTTTSSTTTTTTTTTTLPPPTTTFGPDGRAVSDGERRVAVSETDGLDPETARVEVRGEGFATDGGVYVALCRLADDGTVEVCGGGSAGASVWVSSTAPEYATDLVTPYAADGSFAVNVDVAAQLDTSTDCREVECVIAVRPDDGSPATTNRLLAVPVRFAATSPISAAEPDADLVADTPDDELEDDGDGGDETAGANAAIDTPADADGDGGGGLAVPIVAGVALFAVAAGAGLRWSGRLGGGR